MYIINSMPLNLKKYTIYNHTHLTCINQYIAMSYASLNNSSTGTVPIYETNYMLPS